MPHLKTIAITRPLQDSLRVAERLEQKGYRCIIEPMLTIEPVHAEKALRAALEAHPQGVILTSRHAVYALADYAASLHDIPCFAVGDATAEAARNIGFTQVIVSEGNVAHLVEVIKDAMTEISPPVGGRELPRPAPLLYLRGADVTRDIAHELQQSGIRVSELIMYKATPAKDFSEEYKTALREGAIDSVLFYSLRSCQTYVDIAMREGLHGRHSALEAITTGNFAEALAPLHWKSIRVGVSAL